MHHVMIDEGWVSAEVEQQDEELRLQEELKKAKVIFSILEKQYCRVL